MNKKIVLLPVLLLSLVFFTSCEQTKEASRFDNWQARNKDFVDSLQNVVDKKLDPNLFDMTPTIGSSKTKIYAKKIVTTSTSSPIYTDSVKIAYRGSLINGDVFDQTFVGKDPDMNFDAPAKFVVSNVVTGFIETLQRMKKGERWKIYIPYQQGYGASGQGSILGYSTLIFDITLIDFWSPVPASKSK